jgi:hypothetical protein
VARSFGSEMAAMMADIRAMGPDSKRAMTKTMKSSAGSILQEAKRRASWSSRIPRSLTVRVITRQNQPGIRIVSRSTVAPHGRIYEFGKAGKGRSGSFRAPLFGDRSRWYSHSTRPFIVPSVRNGMNGFREDIDRAVKIAYTKAGFK